MNLNKVFLLGNLTKDPEIRTGSSGQKIASFNIATNVNWTDKTGTKQNKVEFHNIVVFGRLSDIVEKYVRKGLLVLVEGRLQTREWEVKSTGEKRHKTEILADNIQLGPQKDA